MWRTKPPSFDEWLNSDIEYYWINYKPDKLSNFWLQDIVQVTSRDIKNRELIALSTTGLEIKLNSLKDIEGYYWQPVIPPIEDNKSGNMEFCPKCGKEDHINTGQGPCLRS